MDRDNPAMSPIGYPTGGTFADHIYWHLKVWYTRPGVNKSARGTKHWTKEEFIEKFLGIYTLDPESLKTSYENWIGNGRKCPPLPKSAEVISELLFGKEPIVPLWARDLYEARTDSQGNGNNVITRQEAFDEALTKLDAVQSRPVAVTTSAAEQNMPLIKKVLSKLYGRRGDLAKIDEFVESRMDGDSLGLMVITAPAGFGKTTVAVHWCDEAGVAPNRHIVSHLCSANNGDATTTLENVYTHLCQKLARIHGEPVPMSGNEALLISQLVRSAPDEQEIVVWLDGVDEAKEVVPCFLPKVLGERVCVIVSARAEKGVLPGYLSPWLAEDMALSHDVYRHDLDKLKSVDVEELVVGIFLEEELPLPKGLGGRIYRASDGGYALFAHEMTKTAVDAVKNNEEVDLGEAPESLLGYARSEIKRLQRLKDWHLYRPLFEFLTIAREAVNVEELPVLIAFDLSIPSLPQQFLRWIVLTDSEKQFSPPLLSFAHPKLKEVFGRALIDQCIKANIALCNRIIGLEYLKWPIYAFRQLSQHLIEAGLFTQVESNLVDVEFIAARFRMLGAGVSPSIMATDWTAWYGCKDANSATSDNFILLSHLRFWKNYATQLKNLAAQGAIHVWRQLMEDVGLNNTSETSKLIGLQLHLLPDSLATLVGHNGGVAGVLEFNDGSALLSWGYYDALRLWYRSGEEGLELHGHDSGPSGVTELEDGSGFLSWGLDGTLRLWSLSGEKGPVFRGHKRSVCGAIELRSGLGFLSWDSGGTLRLWGRAGEKGPVLQGRDDEILGAIELSDGSGFLSWSRDCSLRLWGIAGEKGSVMHGHEDFVRDAIELKDGSGFASWANDGMLLFWDLSGEKCDGIRVIGDCVLGTLELSCGSRFLFWGYACVLHIWNRIDGLHLKMCGHQKHIVGALELRNSSGFLSWSADGTLRLWGPLGESGPVLYGHNGTVNCAMALEDGSGFISWGRDGTIRYWGPSGEKGPVFCGHEGSVSGVQTLRDGSGFVSWSEDSTLRLWNTIDLHSNMLREYVKPIRRILTLHDGSGFVSLCGDETLHLWGPKGQDGRALQGHKGIVLGVLVLDGGAGFISWSEDCTFSLWDADGEQGSIFRGHENAVLGVLPLDGGAGFISWSEDGTFRLWDAAGGQRSIFRGHENAVLGVLPLDGGAGFISWSGNGAFCLWGPAGEKGPIVRAKNADITTVLALENGSDFLLVRSEHSCYFWNSSGGEGYILRFHSLVHGLIELEDGSGFLSGESEGSICLWSANDGKSWDVYLHARGVTGAVELKDCSGFLSWGYDGTIRLWNRAGQAGAVLKGHDGGVKGALELAAGGDLLSWGADGTVRLWSRNGTLLNVWLSPKGAIADLALTGVPDHYFVGFGGNVGMVHLPRL